MHVFVCGHMCPARVLPPFIYMYVDPYRVTKRSSVGASQLLPTPAAPRVHQTDRLQSLAFALRAAQVRRPPLGRSGSRGDVLASSPFLTGTSLISHFSSLLIFLSPSTPAPLSLHGAPPPSLLSPSASQPPRRWRACSRSATAGSAASLSLLSGGE